MARLWAMTCDFDAIAPGDYLPILIKWETAQSIRARLGPEAADMDEALLQLPEAALRAYLRELLDKGFPPGSLDAEGSRLELELLRPVAPGDTISLSGVVTAKRLEAGRRLVECRLTAEHESGEPAAQATAIVRL